MTKFFATRSARTLATIALTLATLALWSGLTHAAEAPTFRLPGGCVTTTELVTHKDGSQQIVRHTRCEYTQPQRDRMSRKGN